MKIINVKIYTMEDSIIENGYIEFNHGKITAVGEMTNVQSSQDDIDGEGKILLPGFIDAHTHLGMWEDSLGFEGDDGNEDTDPCTPHLRSIDAINPMDRCFAEAVESGVTTVVSGPGSANPIAGQLTALKTFGKCIDTMIVKAPIAIKFALGENPKTVYHGKNQAPVTRMATSALIREQLYKARKYQEQLQKSKNDEEIDEPEFDIKCEALLPLLEGKIAAHFHAHRIDDVFTAIRIAKEFQIDYVIVHGTEGYKFTDEFKKENTAILSGPVICDRSKPELSSLSPSAPGVLSKAGILTAIITDHPVVPIQYLSLCASLCVREGMGYTDALKAITINPAKICRIDDRVGSIKIGKDADFILFDCEPLSLNAKPAMVFIDGERIR